MVIDADVLNMVNSMLEPITVDDATLAIEAIAEVGPGGHFFGTEHTQSVSKQNIFAQWCLIGEIMNRGMKGSCRSPPKGPKDCRTTN